MSAATKAYKHVNNMNTFKHDEMFKGKGKSTDLPLPFTWNTYRPSAVSFSYTQRTVISVTFLSRQSIIIPSCTGHSKRCIVQISYVEVLPSATLNWYSALQEYMADLCLLIGDYGTSPKRIKVPSQLIPFRDTRLSKLTTTYSSSSSSSSSSSASSPSDYPKCLSLFYGFLFLRFYKCKPFP